MDANDFWLNVLSNALGTVLGALVVGLAGYFLWERWLKPKAEEWLMLREVQRRLEALSEGLPANPSLDEYGEWRRAVYDTLGARRSPRAPSPEPKSTRD